ncbi:transposase [Chitinophaga sp. Cy-1792]|uniref:transposase n=1 Tax=Chitinophaga sp. Cy-1792 TaxID=2608339 RepID=UPI001421230B|nr:transposase [Chitinophaga sp. Cy-1792]NIG55701.1 transposase [Chitinophaga sp. Cy-1792]
MDNITTGYLNRAEIWLFVTTLIYFMMNGAQVFETLIFVPKWTGNAPAHFNLLLDGRGTSLKNFWIVFHSLHELTFLLAIIFCWKISFARNWLLLLFAVHFAVRVWTIGYFAPNIMDFQKMATAPVAVKDLAARVARWQTLNYFRVAIFIAVSFGLIPLCYKILQLRP